MFKKLDIKFDDYMVDEILKLSEDEENPLNTTHYNYDVRNYLNIDRVNSYFYNQIFNYINKIFYEIEYNTISIRNIKSNIEEHLKKGFTPNSNFSIGNLVNNFHTDGIHNDEYAIFINITKDKKSCTEFIDYEIEGDYNVYTNNILIKKVESLIDSGEVSIQNLEPNTAYLVDEKFLHRIAPHHASRVFLRLWGIQRHSVKHLLSDH